MALSRLRPSFNEKKSESFLREVPRKFLELVSMKRRVKDKFPLPQWIEADKHVSMKRRVKIHRPN